MRVELLALLLVGCAGSIPDVRRDANDLRDDVAEVRDTVAALAPGILAACPDPRPAHLADACAALDAAWDVARRSIAVANDAIDAYDRTGAAVELVLAAIDKADDAARAVRAALDAVRAVAEP